MTTKIQLRREVEEGLMENVNPMTSDECVILEDDRTLKQALDEMIYIGLGDPTQGDGLITTENDLILTKDGQSFNPLGATGSTTISELEEKLVVMDNDVLVVEDKYYTRKTTKATFLREVNSRIDTMKDKLEQLDSIMNPFNMNLSVSPNVAELGSILSNVRLNWNYNKEIVSQTLNGKVIDKDVRTMIDDSIVNANKTYTLVATLNNGEQKNKSTQLSFMNGVYYGVSNRSEYNSAFILSFTKVLTNSRGRTITVDANTDEYIYYCLPTRLGDCTFSVGGFVGGFAKVDTIDFTNQNGYVEKYSIWRSDNKGLGRTQVNIS